MLLVEGPKDARTWVDERGSIRIRRRYERGRSPGFVAQSQPRGAPAIVLWEGAWHLV